MRQLKFDQPGLEATLLKPMNECGVEKLVCTFVKVILGWWWGCQWVFFSLVVCNQFQYCPASPQCCHTRTCLTLTRARSSSLTLSTTTQIGEPSVPNIFNILIYLFPPYNFRTFKGSLNSPSRVLQEQIGNSFEMSILLVSLLRCQWLEGKCETWSQVCLIMIHWFALC